MFMLLSRIVFAEFMNINTQRQEYIILKESIEPPYYRLNNCSESNVVQSSLVFKLYQRTHGTKNGRPSNGILSKI